MSASVAPRLGVSHLLSVVGPAKPTRFVVVVIVGGFYVLSFLHVQFYVVQHFFFFDCCNVVMMLIAVVVGTQPVVLADRPRCVSYGTNA